MRNPYEFRRAVSLLCLSPSQEAVLVHVGTYLPYLFLPTTHVCAFQRDVSLNARIAQGLTTLPEGEPVLSGPVTRCVEIIRLCCTALRDRMETRATRVCPRNGVETLVKNIDKSRHNFFPFFQRCLIHNENCIIAIEMRVLLWKDARDICLWGIYVSHTYVYISELSETIISKI